jgi:SAM-dependent methyltransferase
VEWYKTAFGRLYTVLYRKRDYDEAEHVLDSFGDLLETAGPILDLACGGGRYMVSAARRGYCVCGLDLSEFLLERAVSRPELTGTVVRGDMRKLPFCDAAFGAVLNMFTSFGYFDTDMDNLIVLREVSRVLKDGGTLLFDFLNSGKVTAVPPGETRRDVNGYSIHERRSLESDGKFLVKRVRAANENTGDSIEYDERVRLYTREELTTMLDSVDLGVSGTFGDYDKGEFDTRKSERIIFICEKLTRRNKVKWSSSR